MRFDFISNKFLRFHNDLINFCGMPLYQNDLLIQNLAIFPIRVLAKVQFYTNKKYRNVTKKKKNWLEVGHLGGFSAPLRFV